MKILTFLSIMMLSLITHAQTINVIVSGSPGGSFFKRSMMYIEGLKNLGFEVNKIKAEQNTKASVIFSNIQEPTVMVWMDQLASMLDVVADADNFIALEYTSPLYLCSITGKESGTVGAPKVYVMQPVLAMGDFVIVPYKNTGATLNAAIAKEVDFAYLSQSQANKLKDAGYSCREVDGISQHAIVIGKNVDLETMRSAIVKIQKQAEFVEWHENSKFKTDFSMEKNDQLNMVTQSQDSWKSAAAQ